MGVWTRSTVILHTRAVLGRQTTVLLRTEKKFLENMAAEDVGHFFPKG